MHTFRRILTYFFLTLGVIFFILICAVLFFWIRVSHVTAPTDTPETDVPTQADVVLDANPYLSETQEKSLKAVGIDPATLPKEITPDMDICFKETLGTDRYNLLASGKEQPSASDFFKARSCL